MSVELPTARFRYRAGTRTFSAFASDLGLSPGRMPEEIALRSEVTGDVKTFRYAGSETDREGDVMEIVYRCNDLTIRIFSE